MYVMTGWAKALALSIGIGAGEPALAPSSTPSSTPAGATLPASAARAAVPASTDAAAASLGRPAAASTSDRGAGTTPVVDPEETWGVRFESARLTAAGRVIDVRYRVLDPAKARRFANRKDKPELADERRGVVLRVPTAPTVGPLRVTANLEEGRVYFMLFANPGRQIQAGTEVALAVGGLRAKLVVQ